MDKEYLEDYEQKENAEYERFVRRMQERDFSFDKDKYPRDERFTKLLRPVVQATRANYWAQIPFCGTLILRLAPVDKRLFEEVYFKVSEIPKVIDFIKDTGRLQIVLSGPPLDYEKLDFMEPFFRDLNSPASFALLPSLFWEAKEILAQQSWKNSTKKYAVLAYSCFLRMHQKEWQPPIYRHRETMPFIPLEEEIDQLIACCGKVKATFLQGLKETGADPGEFIRTRWIDVNKEKRTITINHPVKGHNPRMIPVSRKLIEMLSRLPKKAERVFITNVDYMYQGFRIQRKRAATKLANPRLNKITFVTLRHWKGTMEYHKTKDILHVKGILGHKCIQSTMVYINLDQAYFNQVNEDFTVRVAHNVNESCQLVEVGFEYVTGDYTDGGKIFRKRK